LPVLFALTLLVAAALVFLVQPMVAKLVLPVLGGSPAVWTTCMVFFQAALLAGYAYAHATTAWLGARRQAVLHAALLTLALTFLPVALPRDRAHAPAPEANPIPWLLGLLMATVGVPFVVVSTTAPLLQRWFSRTGDPAAHDPYFLYGASNLGSMLALLGYPLVVEPNVPLAEQGRLWSAGFALLVVLTWTCAAIVWRSATGVPPADGDPMVAARWDRARSLEWLRWVALAMIPSSLMLGVTTYITTDIASVPLLWMIPLALYLLTFILVFARRPPLPHSWMVRLLPTVVVPLALILSGGWVQPFLVPLHLLVFFAAAMVCHGELARSRPPAERLTEFYLALALGGMLGGVLNALVAPLVFDRVVEYPLMMVLACLALPGVGRDARRLRERPRDALIPATILVLSAGLATNVLGVSETLVGVAGVMLASGLLILIWLSSARRPLRFALGIGAVLLGCGLSPGVSGRVVHRERGFFGVLRVTHVEEGNYHRLHHGTTLHGQQCLSPGRRREPLTYFHRTGPIAQVFDAVHARSPGAAIAIVGLGAGTMACYATPDQRWTFYEIDPAVVRIARDPRYFTFLHDCRAASLDIVLGDARLRLQDAPEQGYALIILDAFSSDAVPVHLLTREAVRLYRRKLAAGGIIVFNISNRFIDFNPIMGRLARDAGLVCRIRSDLIVPPNLRRQGKQDSIWAVLAARVEDFGALANDPRWLPPRLRAGEAVWTDDYSDLVRSMHFWPAAGSRAGR
jgi:hypothetical protein